MSQFARKLKAFIEKRDPQGCSAEEIASLVAQSEAVLPESYRQFMEVAGNGVADFLQGSDFTLRELDGVREAANELLEAAGLPTLPSDAFVFTMHQGYQFYFFDKGEVFYFREGAKDVEKRFDSFEEFFDYVIDNIEKRSNA